MNSRDSQRYTKEGNNKNKLKLNKIPNSNTTKKQRNLAKLRPEFFYKINKTEQLLARMLKGKKVRERNCK